ncbi:hypothetical protein OsI_31312 [Oryza sativa Indica Group]|uniref:Uncharacterized protein n=2 Tax=Oryza sativa TaxID=4530 RepID=B9G3I0_ORYSJ|nr:hypothetical protein OsI_31312 [Oryza sativa Indica Group]EEE69677.1 hypothetical protein OsJ_29305 [Oryza sativa Japonica Group]
MARSPSRSEGGAEDGGTGGGGRGGEVRALLLEPVAVAVVFDDGDDGGRGSKGSRAERTRERRQAGEQQAIVVALIPRLSHSPRSLHEFLSQMRYTARTRRSTTRDDGSVGSELLFADSEQW